MPSRCCEFVDSRLRRSPPDRASAVPMDKPGKTRCVSPTLPTGRRLLHKLHSTPQQHGMILISGNGEITSQLYAFSLFFPGSCPNNRDRRTPRCRKEEIGIMITPAQCRSARTLLSWSINKLASAASVSGTVIDDFELERREPDAATLDAIRRTFEDVGVVFLPDGDVRMRAAESTAT